MLLPFFARCRLPCGHLPGPFTCPHRPDL